MQNKSYLKRSLAGLLSLLLAWTLIPAAAASSSLMVCPECKQTTLSSTVVRRANCHETGVIEYKCSNSSCNYYNLSSTNSTDPTYHDAVYTDNGNGTHSGVCAHDGARIEGEKHTFGLNGRCEKCGAYNYGQVVMNLPDRTVPVALNNADAKLTAGSVQLVLDRADITEDYDITYSWYYQGKQVSTSAECPLPASVYGKEGVYYYNLYVMAVPKGEINRQPVSESCTITVQVEELVVASAIITTEDVALRMDESDYWSGDSISSQIYEAAKIFCGRNADPDYVVFDLNSKSGVTVGDLDVASGTTHYYFSWNNSSLDDLRFTTKGVAGDYTIGFTVYDTAGKSYAGVLTITVQQYVGSMDVLYIVSRNEPFNLSSADFEAFWAKVNPRGALDYISFNEIPRSVDGALYADYTSQALPGDRVRTSDLYYVEPGKTEYGIDEVTFLPGVAQSSYITLGFTAFGTRGTGYTSRRDGTMYIFFTSEAQSADVSLTVSATGAALDPAAFQKAYQTAVGGTGASFYIQLLDVPASGALYTGRTGSKEGVRLTQSAVEGRPFAYNGSMNETISSLTYVPGSAKEESIRYVVSSAQGTPLFAGKIIFSTGGSTGSTDSTDSDNSTASAANRVSYKCGPSGVAFQAGDFADLPGKDAPKLNMVSFTLPASSDGVLYWGRTASSAGTPITNPNEWYSVSATAVANSVNNITFVPAAGHVGLVTIAFDAINNSGSRSSGTVQITVGSTDTTTNPGATSNPGTTTTLPVKTFSDVPGSEWFYTYVTDLTTSGVLNGYPDGTFRPNGAVKFSEALKMILIAAGYPEQAATGSHWASGYLARAQADSLLPASVLADMAKLKNPYDMLERNISRYDIAEITSRAMKLTAVAVASSPFTDMEATDAYAPYVMSLYNAGIITGDTDKNGQPIYNGKYAIRRSEFAAVIWRVQNYVRTGSANGAAAAG